MLLYVDVIHQNQCTKSLLMRSITDEIDFIIKYMFRIIEIIESWIYYEI